MTGPGSGSQASKVTDARKDQIKEILRPPDKEPTPALWLGRAMLLPEVSKVMLRRYVGGAWSVIEDMHDALGPGFKADEIDVYVQQRHGDGRYRLESREEGGAMLAVSPVLFIGNWQTAERAPAAAAGPAIGQSGVAHPPSDLKRIMGDRIEIKSAMALERDLDASQHTASMAPVKMMADMMASSLEMMKGVMAAREQKTDTTPGQDMIFQMLLKQMEQNQAMMLAMVTKGESGDSGGLKGALELIDTLRTTFGVEIGKGVPGTDWAQVATVAAPILQETLAAVKEIAGARNRGPGALVHRVPGGTTMPIIPEVAAPPTQEEMNAMINRLPHPLLPVFDVMIQALKSRDFPTVNAGIINLKDGAGRPIIEIDPDANAAIYVGLLTVHDARFAALKEEMAEYVAWVKVGEEPENVP